MKQHIILERAYVYDNPRHESVPEGCTYDRKCGLWRVNETNEVMMTSDIAEKPETKKCDVETGEDQKGE